MARGKKNTSSQGTSTVSEPSEGESSDDSMGAERPQKKKVAKPKEKAAQKKMTPTKKLPKKANEPGGPIDDDEDDEQKGLVQDYDEENLLDIQVPPKPVPCMAAEGGQRLMITDITVHNFKSYYGRRRIGPFHQSFTAIIGPNGSGKSNVIDALLFVFGYKASKIRSKKVSVLIHSSSGKDDLESCTVKISFQKIIDNPDGTYDVVPNSHFHVSRTGYRNNSSEYRMDDKRVSFKEVAATLKHVGIDLIHNRFLILQGEVEQIAMMKPKSIKEGEDGMLEYLEDIIGSSRFKMPIEKLQSKLDKIQADRSVQIAKVNEANRAKESLDEPVQTHLSFLQMENEVAALNCKQQLFGKYNATSGLEKLAPEKENIEAEVAKMNSDLSEVTTKQKEKKDEIDNMAKEMKSVQNSIHKGNSEMENLVQKDKKRQNDLTRLVNEMKKLETELMKEKDKLEAVTAEPIKAEKKMKELVGQLEAHNDELNKAQEKFDANFPQYNKKTEGDRARKTKLEEEYSGIAARLAEATSKCKIAESALKGISEEYDKKKAQLEELENTIRANEEKREKDTDSLASLRVEIEKAEEEKKSMEEEIKNIDERSEQIKKRLTALAPMFSEKQAEAQARVSSNRITQLFENAVKNGKMQGYIGRLGNLGWIDPKYDRAISNNVNLDYYLVENGKTTAEGSELLKKIDCRAQFLSLDKVQSQWRYLKETEAEKKRGGLAPRLYNMVHCEDKYKPAFYFAIRGSYVVDSMDDATELFKKMKNGKMRVDSVISADGRGMIQSTGTYVGGGAIIEGKMSTSKDKVVNVRRESMAKEDEEEAKKTREAEAEKHSLQSEMQASAQRRYQLTMENDNRVEPRLANQKVAMRELEKQIKKSEDSIRYQTEQREIRVKEVEKAKVDENEVEEKKKEIDSLRKDRDAANDDSKSFKTKIKAIQTEIDKVYAKLVEPYETAIGTARTSIESAEKEQAKQQAVINGADRNIAKQQSKVEDVEKDVEEKRTKSEKLKGDEEEFTTQKEAKQESLDGLAKEKDELEEKLKEARKGSSELDAHEIELIKEKKVVEEKQKEVRGKIVGLERAIENYNTNIVKLTKSLHDITGLLFDVPEDIQQSSTARRFLVDGESDSDMDDFELFMATPSRKKELQERQGLREGPPKNKRRKMEELMDEEEDEEDDKENVKMKKEGDDVNMEDAKTAADDDVKCKEETKEEARARKTKMQQEQQLEWEATLKAGHMPDWPQKHIMRSNQDAIKLLLDDLEKRIASTRKNLQKHVLEDYKKRVEILKKESDLLHELKVKYVAHREKIDGFKKERLEEFMGGFDLIASSLRELYQMITLGGDAMLTLKDPIDPFMEGVQFTVRPPKKSWKNIENLSGGEKTLSSLALVFALHRFRPTPLYVMDEIDAALDFRNVSIIGHYIKDRTKNAQFIIISLRNNMFELADRLVGIYKVHDCTRNVVVDPMMVLEEAEQLPRNEKARALIEANKIETSEEVEIPKRKPGEPHPWTDFDH